MSKVSHDEIKKIANLARISIGDDETNNFSKQVSDIISWVEQLDQVDTKDVIPMMAVDNKLRMREDKIDIKNDTSEILQNCCEQQFDFFAVPKIIESND